ncbi:uncharacterized protein CLUP02_11835 [Colletotrichum lupini]|uniref:Uncharacterized protein n=1 Tax=Colletotrichum lupini TaxID=145971 RepID=A0A9Q8T052_9PEZI|nr:uncharacterized protein CLUP02_11835 [Colletotrichum lupini]UQC86335.1 hypothetical protein CLUP02_11835 [Colletotrichum lupini]
MNADDGVEITKGLPVIVSSLLSGWMSMLGRRMELLPLLDRFRDIASLSPEPKTSLNGQQVVHSPRMASHQGGINLLQHHIQYNVSVGFEIAVEHAPE